MAGFIARRLLQAIPTLFGIMLLSFLLMRLSPADPITIATGQNPDITPEDRAALYAAYGLDRPLPVQFLDFVWQALRFDFGQSLQYHRPVTAMIVERIPNSIQPVILGLVVAVVLGVPLGMLGALHRGRAPDHGVRILTVAAQAVPDFFLGLLFVLFLGVQLRWFPIGSMNVIGESCALCWDRAWHLIGPTLLYANGGLALYPRLMRTEMLEILAQDFVRTARAKGLRERVVVGSHAFRNALIPMVTVLGPILGIFLSGSVVVEQIFTWPGLGRLGFEAANAKDYPVVQAFVVIGGELLLLGYILRDIAYAWVDPRIRVR